jgi:replicative DNA helicase
MSFESELGLPQSLEAERAVLGSLLIRPEQLADISELVKPNDFSLQRHRRMYTTMLDLAADNRLIDVITVKDALLPDDPDIVSFCADIAAEVPTPTRALDYARLVREKAVLRLLISICRKTVGGAMDQPADVGRFADSVVADIFNACYGDRQSRLIRPVHEISTEAIALMESWNNKGDRPEGIKTHYSKLDEVLGGFEPGTLSILAARPSMGKTALGLEIARRNAMRKHPTAFFSLEMTSSEVAMRLLCMEAKVNSQRVRAGYASGNDFERLGGAKAKLDLWPLYVDDSAQLPPIQIRNRCRQICQKIKRDLDLIVVDYLQLMTPDRLRDREEREVADISAALKILARDFKCPVIALSQLNREAEHRTGNNHRPRLSDLRESGALEQDADAVMFLYRENVYRKEPGNENVAEVIVAKNRNGPTGTVKLTWIPEHTRFENYVGEWPQ